MEDGVREIDIDTIADSERPTCSPVGLGIAWKPVSARLDDTEPRDVIEQSVYLDIDRTKRAVSRHRAER